MSCKKRRICTTRISGDATICFWRGRSGFDSQAPHGLPRLKSVPKPPWLRRSATKGATLSKVTPIEESMAESDDRSPQAGQMKV